MEDADRRMPNTGGLVKKNEYNKKITKIESGIPSVTD